MSNIVSEAAAVTAEFKTYTSIDVLRSTYTADDVTMKYSLSKVTGPVTNNSSELASAMGSNQAVYSCLLQEQKLSSLNLRILKSVNTTSYLQR